MSPMGTGQIINAGLGSVVGLILALTSASGAIVAVLLLIFGLYLLVSEAAPIVLLVVGLSVGLGATFGLCEGRARYKTTGLMVLCGAVISPFGIWVVHRIPNTPPTPLFAVVLAYVTVRMFRQTRAAPSIEPRPRRTAPPCHLDSTTAELVWVPPYARTLAVLSVGTGFLSGLLDMGGDFVIVPTLRRAIDLPMRTVVVTPLAVIVLVSVGGVAASVIGGHVDWHIAPPFAAGASAGMLVGWRFAQHLVGSALQQGFAVLADVVVLRMIV